MPGGYSGHPRPEVWYLAAARPSPSTTVGALILLPAQLYHIHTAGIIAQQVLAEVIRSQPEEVVVHITEAVACAGKDEEVESLIRPDECAGEP